MSVKHILVRAGGKMGIDPDGPQRPSLIAFLNEAAEELYDQSDMPGSMIEQVFRVNGDQTITFPSSVGTLRAVRELASMAPWHINQMRPRYNQYNWTDIWRNWRLKNIQCLQNSVVNESVGVITVAEVENPPIVVSVSGPTDKAALVNEQIVMDATSKQTVSNFTDYTSFKKDRINNFDIVLSDVDGRVLTTLPNNVLEAEYQIVDISNFPWLSRSTSPLDNYVEVLYKKKLPFLFNDDDEFPGTNCDRILVNKILQLWNEEQEKEEAASAYDAKATRSLARLTENQNRETEDMVSLVAHPHDTLLRKITSGVRRRFGFYGRRSY